VHRRSGILNFCVKISVSTGHGSYEAWREGDHDDLVLTASLSAWKARKGVWTLRISRA
jgi:hypothetical protein